MRLVGLYTYTDKSIVFIGKTMREEDEMNEKYGFKLSDTINLTFGAIFLGFALKLNTFARFADEIDVIHFFIVFFSFFLFFFFFF